jgi:acyl carrier protein
VTRDEIRAALLDLVGRVAPEADLASLDPSRDLRSQVDIDSLDLLHLMVAVRERFGIDVPEHDYGRLRTLDDAADYLAARGAGT